MKTLRIISLALVLVMAACFFASCGSSIVGKWTYEAKVGEVTTVYTLEFKDGEKGTISVKAGDTDAVSYDFTYKTADGTLTMDSEDALGKVAVAMFNGAYEIKDDTLTVNKIAFKKA